ncbi:MAG: FHA domain-containing protein [Anaerolineaceae bacterium]|nr:FHA domain-containing protein [Anaerolineaceae bacterium]
MARTGSELPVLIGQMGPLNGQRWLIARTLTIGRDASCDVVIPDRQVSRYHARVTPGTEGVILEDLGSKNGTFHNGKKIGDPSFLQDGDSIQVALLQNFVFLSSDATMPMDSNKLPLGEPERIGRLYLEARSRRVWINQKEVVPPLSVPQFRLLQALYEQQGRVVSRQDLIVATWGDQEAFGVSEQALDALIRRLRDRLAMLDPIQGYIVTVRGHGIRLDNPEK